jgi:hypothetical protein
LHDPVEGFLGAGVDDDFGRDVAALAGDASDGAADQADAEQGEALEEGFRHDVAA